MQDIASLIEFNKKSLFRKLENCVKVQCDNKVGWVCNEIIDILSDKKSTDRRLINDYLEDEVFTQVVSVDNLIRKYRIFTLKGIERYLYEGHIYNYNNACEFFGIIPRDKNLDKLKTTYIGKEFIKSKILRWLFGKQKTVRSMPSSVPFETFEIWLKEYTGDIDKLKKEYLLDFIKKEKVYL